MVAIDERVLREGRPRERWKTWLGTVAFAVVVPVSESVSALRRLDRVGVEAGEGRSIEIRRAARVAA